MEQELVQHPCLGRAPGIGTGGQYLGWSPGPVAKSLEPPAVAATAVLLLPDGHLGFV